MSLYYVNKNAQDSDEHEVHVANCEYFPDQENAEYLGAFDTCHEAIEAARLRYKEVDGCFYCCYPCHHF